MQLARMFDESFPPSNQSIQRVPHRTNLKNSASIKLYPSQATINHPSSKKWIHNLSVFHVLFSFVHISPFPKHSSSDDIELIGFIVEH